MNEQVTPFDLDVERLVLGSIMGGGSESVRAFSILKPSDFFKPEHQTIFALMHKMVQQGKEIDLHTLSEYVYHQGAAELVGGIVYLMDCLGESTLSWSENHTRILLRLSILRRVITSCQSTLDDCYAKKDPDAILDQLNNSLSSLSYNENWLSPLPKIAMAVIEAMEDRQQMAAPEALRTGFIPLDHKTGGLPNAYITISGRSHTGKTELALRWAEHIAQTKPVLFYSLEMEAKQLFYRTLFNKTGLSYREVFRPMDMLTFNRFNSGMKQILDSQLFIMESPDANLGQVLADILACYHRIHPAAVFVDHLHLIPPPDGKEYAHLNNCLYRLRAMQKKLGIPFVVLCQVSKMGPERVKDLQSSKLVWISGEDLRGSGRIYDMSQLVFLIHFPGKLEEGQTETDFVLQLAKNQIFGGRGLWDYHYKMDTGEFTWIEPKHQLSGKEKASGETDTEPF